MTDRAEQQTRDRTIWEQRQRQRAGHRDKTGAEEQAGRAGVKEQPHYVWAGVGTRVRIITYQT